MIRRSISIFLGLLFFFISPYTNAQVADTLHLDGLWRFQLDPMGFGKTPGSELYLTVLPETIMLPGSTDEGGKGIRNTAKYVDRLSRKFEYCGPAWYQREIVIPDEWSGRRIMLELERCHWETTVYVDGKLQGTDERLSTPNRFILALTPGVHTITLCVDNRMKYPMDQWAHGITEYTQTNWNGVTGSIILRALPATAIDYVRVYPNIDNGIINADIRTTGNHRAVNLRVAVRDADGCEVAQTLTPIAGGSDTVVTSVCLPMGRDFQMWDEFNPYLYTIRATVENTDGDISDTAGIRFGMREVRQGQHHIIINGIKRHLRGVLDCCVFPLTGYPSTDPAEWLRIFSTVRAYGFNHVRFHSWCPPQAAFEAADQLGLYLQVELPMWIKDVGRYSERRDFFEKEMMAILDEYGNHPSFVLYCNGNENEGDFSVLEDLIKKGMTHDSRHLYSASTARTHVKSDQFYTSHMGPKGWLTVYEGRPSTDWNLNESCDMDVPVIAHETGQRCMYPDFREIPKYTGVLEPRNIAVFQESLAHNGMAHQADDFFRATGAHTVLQYKEVNEALLRTSTSGGYQILGLQDFPGQGSAYVGILDAFWDSKGLVAPEKYRESNGDVVILTRMPKRVYNPSEPFTAKIGVYNFGPKRLAKGALIWSVVNSKGDKVLEGRLPHSTVNRSTVDSLGVIKFGLDRFATPEKYTLHVNSSEGHHNEWNFWVYDNETERSAETNRTAISSWTEARSRLARGEAVLFIPDSVVGRATKFTGHFWNPIMFNWDPMIVGTLIDSTHKSLAGFPTDDYADWQWTDILDHSTALDLTSIEKLTPVIQSIDSYEHNRKLGVAFEVATTEGGRLFVLCTDTCKNMANRPATTQLLHSVNDYVNSDEFQPTLTVPLYRLDEIFSSSTIKGSGSESEAVKQLLNR